MNLFRFGTKAETLQRLALALGSDCFCPQQYFTVADWLRERETVASRLIAEFSPNELVVRSSRKDEDGVDASMAGAFLSIVGVVPSMQTVTAAVDRVLESYGRVEPEDQVLVQPQVTGVDLSGVLTTRHLDTGAPYYVINYDDTTGRTDTVTGGGQSKIVLVHRERHGALRSPRLGKLISVVKRIEATAGSAELDVEFCITKSNEIYIFQVRPLAASKSWQRTADASVDLEIDKAREQFQISSSRRPGLAGPAAIYGQMPDWNPAEMIGSLPKPLAYSIYKTFITDSSWSEARYRMGYRDVRGTPLMYAFAGRPYIDVRASLNSFLPAAVAPQLAERLVDFQLQKLAANRELHDRIEFSIAFPNLDFAFDQRIGELEDAGLTSSEIAAFRVSLGGLTARLVETGLQDLKLLERQTEALDTLGAGEHGTGRQAILDTIAQGTVNGAIPFAMLARHGFVAVSFLKSLVHRSIVTPAQVDAFIGSVRTVAAELVADLDLVHEGATQREVFLARYGHLRPGTYDISSPRYDKQPDLFLSGQRSKRAHTEKQTAAHLPLGEITKMLSEVQINLDASTFLRYVAEAIRLRELAKFRYTIAVSHLLELVAGWGETNGFSRDDVAYLTLGEIIKGDRHQQVDAIEAARDTLQAHRLTCLPHLIIESRDFDVVRMPLNVPTYITQKSIVAPATQVATGAGGAIAGRIVLIESADPGFDWIFSYDIAGLVTKFGGANSHMAIRCAEFGLPAAIGCGERLYAALEKGQFLELNCAVQSVRVLS